MAQVRIPSPLRTFTQGKDQVPAAGNTIAEVLANLDKDFPGLKARICDENGVVRRFVNIFANDEDIRYLQNLDTPIQDTDEISIVPAIAGGGR